MPRTSAGKRYEANLRETLWDFSDFWTSPRSFDLTVDQIVTLNGTQTWFRVHSGGNKSFKLTLKRNSIFGKRSGVTQTMRMMPDQWITLRSPLKIHVMDPSTNWDRTPFVTQSGSCELYRKDLSLEVNSPASDPEEDKVQINLQLLEWSEARCSRPTLGPTISEEKICRGEGDHWDFYSEYPLFRIPPCLLQNVLVPKFAGNVQKWGFRRRRRRKCLRSEKLFRIPPC